MKGEEILKDKLKRLLNTHQLYRQALQDIRESETVTELARQAKENKRKGFIDLRVVAADAIRGLDNMLLKIKPTMTPVTWRAIMQHLSSEELLELSLTMDIAFSIKNPEKMREVLMNCIVREE